MRNWPMWVWLGIGKTFPLVQVPILTTVCKYTSLQMIDQCEENWQLWLPLPRGLQPETVAYGDLLPRLTNSELHRINTLWLVLKELVPHPHVCMIQPTPVFLHCVSFFQTLNTPGKFPDPSPAQYSIDSFLIFPKLLSSYKTLPLGKQPEMLLKDGVAAWGGRTEELRSPASGYFSGWLATKLHPSPNTLQCPAPVGNCAILWKQSSQKCSREDAGIVN